MNALATLFIAEQDRHLRYTRVRHVRSGQLPPAEVVGKTDADLLPPAEALLFTKLKEQLLQTGESIAVRQAITWGGEKRTFDVMLDPLGCSGHVTGVLVTAIDMTELTQAHDKLRRQEHWYRFLVENLSEGIWCLDAQASFTFVNPQVQRILGYAPDEMIGRCLFDFMDKHHATQSRAVFAQRRQGISGPIEREMLHKDGRKVWISGRSTPIFDDDGAFAGALAGIQDATERRHAELYLRRSELRYRSLASLSPDGIVVSSDGRFTFANEAAAKLLGAQTPDELIGRPVLDIVCPEDRTRAQEHMRLTVERNLSVGPREYRILRLDGQPAEIEVSSVPLWLGDGWGVQTVGRDVTERNRMARELADQQQRLRSLASELTRTRERERRRLACSLHDGLAQLLAFTKLQVDALEEANRFRYTGSELREISAFLRKAVQEVRTLTVDLASPILYEFGLQAAVEDWLENEIRGRYALDTNLTWAGGRVDDTDLAAFLYRAVRELTANVVKHAHAQRVNVNLRLHNGIAQLIVTDDGVGFDCSSDPEKAEKRNSFGLLSVREQTRHYGGDFEVTSVPGRGACVRLELPLATGDTGVGEFYERTNPAG